MPRCLMPAIAVLVAGGDRLKPIIFDSDGLPADERVDFAGDSKSSLTYRILRRVEARMLRASSIVLVRTPRAAEILGSRSEIGGERFRVVANGRDQDVFRPYDSATRRAVREELGIGADAPLIVYAGSIGPKYRFDLIRSFSKALESRRPDARLLVLTGSPELAPDALGVNPALSPIVLRVAPHSVAKYLAAADLGLAFVREGYSSQAVAPLKVAEYLMCGVPVLGTGAVGPLNAAANAQVFLDEGAGLEEAAQWLTETVLPERERFRERARAAGIANFSLSRSIADYLSAVESLRCTSQRTASLNLAAAVRAE
jgi:glycosyltransferase involved in cell wall biosynthesis